MKKFLNYISFSLVLIVSVFMFSGCTYDAEKDIITIQGQITTINTQLETLQTQINSNVQSNTDLQSQISSINTQINSIQNQIDDLEDSNTQSITNLQNQINTLNQTLTNIQNQMNGSMSKVFTIGDTVSYSYNGIKYFELTCTEFSYRVNPIIAFDYQYNNNIEMASLFDATLIPVGATKMTTLESEPKHLYSKLMFTFNPDIDKNQNYYIFIYFTGTPVGIFYV
ncbi:MAG: hypothetical protein IJZ29_02750 [Clostridia bacterium]|nr:hypothetical protein [Clostridia bacterium]